MKYFKTHKSIRSEIISKISFILFLDCFIVAGLFFDGTPTTDKIVTFSVIGFALTIVFGYSLLKDHNKNKKLFIRVEEQNLCIGGDNFQTNVDLKSISKIVKGIKQDKVAFLRIKAPDFGWWAIEGYENLGDLSELIIENSPNAAIKIKKKGLISLSKY